MFDELCIQIRSEFPDFKLVRKQDSAMMKALGFLLKVVTLWQARQFMQSYITTIGRTVYTNVDWEAMDEASRCIVLRHERVHMRQAARLGRLWFSFLYAVPFLPLGLAWWRAKLEMEAYEESIRATVELRGTNIVFSKEYRAWMLRQFCGSMYGWMWPFPKAINRWFDGAVDKAVREYIARPKPVQQARGL